MKKRTSPAARVLAVVALLGSFVVLLVVVTAALDSGGSDSGGGKAQQAQHHDQPVKKTPATYVIKSGDTLTAISHATGVGVGQIERLNPEVDPQILIAGEKIKLK
jgi:LysM repeat protein